MTTDVRPGTGRGSPLPPRAAPPLARRNPAVKFAAVTLVSVTLLAVFDPVTPALLYVVTFVAVAVGARPGWRALTLGQVPFLAFALSLLAVNAITRGGEVVARLGPFEVTDDGLAVGASLGLRTLVIGVSVIGFVRSTDPVDLLTSLRTQARLPAKVAYACLAAYRLLDDLPERWTTIRRAHAVRGPGPRGSALPRSPRALARAAWTLLVTSLRQADRLATTLELRGLGAGPRTTWRPTPVGAADVLLLLGVAATTAGVIAAGALGGWLRGFGALFG